MNLKKIWLLGFAMMWAILIAWCNQSTPELSFEDTLKVYGEQKSMLSEVSSFMNDKESQIKDTFELTTKYATENSNWKVVAKTLIINDNATKDSKAEISLLLDTDADITKTEGFLVKSAKIDLDTLVKDFKIYFKLVDISAEANQKEYVWTMLALIDWFKDRWFTLNNPEITELLKASNSKEFDLTEYIENQENLEKLFNKKESTKYDGDPAWKVDFNMDEVKSFIKEVYRLSQGDLTTLGEENPLLIEQQQENIEEFNELIDNVQVSNVEAYFVIRSEDKVDFVIENIDIQWDTALLNIKETINKKMIWDDSLTYTILLSQATSEEDEDIDNIQMRAVIDLVPSLLTYGINLKVESIINDEIEEMFNAKWNITASISDKNVELSPTFNVNFSNIKANVEAKLKSEKINDYEFESPENAEDIEEVIGSLMWGQEYENQTSDEDFIDDEWEINLDEESDDAEIE